MAKETAERKTYLSDKELEEFRTLLKSKRKEALEIIEDIRGRLDDANDQAEGYTYHMADAGSDAMDREMLYLMIARQQKYIGYVDRAVERIDNKTYGVCKLSGNPIPKERLKVVPTTETTVDAKLLEKRKNNNVG